MEKSGVLKESACALENVESVHPDESMDRKFQDTYEEVMALKRMLQDLLHGDQHPLAVEEKACSDDQYSEDFERKDELFSAESSAPTSPCDPLSPRRLRDSWSSFGSSVRGSDRPTVQARKLMVVVPTRQRSVPKRMTPTSIAVQPKSSRKCLSKLKPDKERQTKIVVASGKPPITRVGISKASAAVLRKSAHFEPDFQVRVQDYIARTRQKREKIRLELAEKEDNEIKLSPVINRRSKRIYRSISHLLAWNNEKKSKLAQLRTLEVKKQESAFVGKPAIDRHSTRLFTERDDEIAGCKVEDRLHLLGLIYEYQQEERQLQQQRQQANEQLQLAPHSGNLSRSDRMLVHERLYQQSKRVVDSGSPTKPADGPTLKANEESLSAAIERLCLMGDHYKQKRLRLQQQRDQQLLAMHNTKKLTTKSRRLADKRNTKIGKCGCISRCRSCRLKQENKTTESGDASSKPRIRIDPAHAKEIYERQLEWKQRNDKRFQSQRQAQDDIMLSHCTFRNPYFHQAWATTNSLRDRVDSSSGNNIAFFERCMRWMANKERRVAQEKKFRQALEFEECTFRPYIRSNRSPSKNTATAISASQTLYDESDSPFERQSICCSCPGRSESEKPDPLVEENLQYYIPPENEFTGFYEYDEQDLEALAATSPSEYKYDFVSQRRRNSGFDDDV